MHCLERVIPARRRPAAAPRGERGIALLVVTALLLAVGLMGLTAFHLSRGQFQLVGNLQFQEQAFSRAEAVSAVAERWLATGTNARSSAFETYDASAKGLYPSGQLAVLGLDPKSMNWSDANSIAVGSDGRYLVEQIGRGVKLPGGSLQVGQKRSAACRSVDLFRIVARSSSVRGSSRIVETYHATDAC